LSANKVGQQKSVMQKSADFVGR